MGMSHASLPFPQGDSGDLWSVGGVLQGIVSWGDVPVTRHHQARCLYQSLQLLEWIKETMKRELTIWAYYLCPRSPILTWNGTGPSPQDPVQGPEVSRGLACLRPEPVLMVTCLIPR